MAAIGLAATAASRPGQATAAINCAPHQNTEDELAFVAALQAWRDSNIPGSHQLTRSISLNKAAWYYARFLADNAGTAGHYADGNNWVTRAQQCGYPGNSAGGEGLALVEASQPVDVSPAQAISIMASHRGSGIYIPANVGADVKCVGAAKAVSSDGQRVAWVTVLMTTWQGCADPDTSGPPSAATNTVTNTHTPTNTPTKTPTPSPTPTPTPNANYQVAIQLCQGWNLVTMPVGGPVDDIFDTAVFELGAIYYPNGETWLRWAPDVPAYARNLGHVSSGDVLWIFRSDPSCESVGL